MYGYVYKTTNNVNGKIYVGQHKSERFDPEYKGSGKLLQHALEKYLTENFNVELLEWCENKEDLDNKEIFYIAKFDATNRDVGYNIAVGGQGGDLGPEIRAKISHSLKNNGNHYTHRGRTSYIDENGKIRYIPVDETPPEGWVRGNSASGKIVVTDGDVQRLIDKGSDIPQGFAHTSLLNGKPRSLESVLKMKETLSHHDYSDYIGPNIGKILVTDGEKDRYVDDVSEMTPNEHLGSKRKGVDNPNYSAAWTEDRKSEFSQKMSGENNPMYGNGHRISGEKNGRFGKPVSKETKEKISKANTGRRYSDEINKKKGRPGVKKPDGFGEKISKANKGKVVSDETRQKISIANQGKIHGKVYNNGIIERRFKDDDIIPEGFVLGNKRKGCKTNRNTIENKHWYNNGIQEKYFEDDHVPTGWMKGRLKRENKKNT